MSRSGILTGLVLFIAGLVLMMFSIAQIDDKVGAIVFFIQGLIILGIGIYMLLNSKKENKIEKIENNKNFKVEEEK